MNLPIPKTIKQLKQHLNDPLYKNSLFLVLSRVFNVACGFFFWMLANLSFTKKALPTTFLPSVKTLTKNLLLVFLLAQVFFLQKRKSVKKALPKKQKEGRNV